MSLVVAQLNCGNKDQDRTPDDLVKMDADLYDLQETFDRARALREWAKEEGMKRVPFMQGDGDTPQFYKARKLELLEYRAYPVNLQPVYVGDKGNGPPTIHPKFITHAKFRVIEDRRIINNFNTHPLASWTRTDLPPEEQRRRHELGVKHIRILTAQVNKVRNATVCLDANAHSDYPGMRPLVKALKWEYGDGPDFAGAKGDPIRKVEFEVVHNLSSDHDGIRMTLHFKGRR